MTAMTAMTAMTPMSAISAVTNPDSAGDGQRIAGTGKTDRIGRPRIEVVPGYTWF
jgi:hypothetical protein